MKSVMGPLFDTFDSGQEVDLNKKVNAYMYANERVMTIALLLKNDAKKDMNKKSYQKVERSEIKLYRSVHWIIF